MAFSEREIRGLLQKKQRSIKHLEDASEKGKISLILTYFSMKRLTMAIAAVAALSVAAGLLLVFGRFFQGDLTGTVFIVTRGGQNVKLGLVEVKAIPEHEILSFLQEEQAVVKKERDDLRDLVEEALRQAQKAKHEYQEAGNEDKVEKGLAATEKVFAWMVLKDKFSRWTPCHRYLNDLPAGVASTKTDADGAFSLRLRRGVKYALAAEARREVVEDTEEYCWLTWVTLGGNQTKVFLSNDNLFTPDSISSIVSATD